PVEQYHQLLEKVGYGRFIMLYGTHASGKSTLKSFWPTFGKALSCDHQKQYFAACEKIQDASDFLVQFSKNSWDEHSTAGEVHVILFIDEFDKLHDAPEDVHDEVLETFHAIRNNSQDFIISAIVAVVIGTFSILYIDTSFKTSPFNIKESIWNHNHSLDQVQELYNQFASDTKMKIDQEVIEDIYFQTNGHATLYLVCLCGRVIEEKLIGSLDITRHVSYKIWHSFSVMSLMSEVSRCQTWKHMVDRLLHPAAKAAVELFRSKFMLNTDFVEIYEDEEVKLANFLAAEGLLVVNDLTKFKIASPLVEVPYYPSSDTLNTFEVLKHAQAHVPVIIPIREMYHEKVCMRERCVEFCGIGFSSMDSKSPGGILHEAGKLTNKMYSDIVLSMTSDRTIVIELLSTATKGQLEEHFSCWPSEQQLEDGLQVAHVWHDLGFETVRISARWRDEKSVQRELSMRKFSEDGLEDVWGWDGKEHNRISM
ncbi:7031_t:CDS:2, partial [Paraglomus occultum]